MSVERRATGVRVKPNKTKGEKGGLSVFMKGKQGDVSFRRAEYFAFFGCGRLSGSGRRFR